MLTVYQNIAESEFPITVFVVGLVFVLGGVTHTWQHRYSLC